MNEPLRVILNDRPLRQTLTGVGHYIEQILRHLPAVAPEVCVDPFFFTYLTRRDWRDRVQPADADSSNAPRLAADSSSASARHPRDVGGSRKPWWLRRIMQGAYAGIFRMKAGRYALYHEPNHIPMRCGLPTVTTVHDLSVLVHPQWHPADRVRWYEREFDAGVRRTTRFIAASEFTKREMVQRLGIAASRIDVTYQAPRPAFHRHDAAAVGRTLAALGLQDGFFLYVGTLEPRKNVEGLLEAYAGLPADVRRRRPLVLAGAWGWKQDAIRERLARHALDHHTRIVGYLSDASLAHLYAACAALVWPTLYEGFGMPPLEAMACGAPVIVSDVASLPEVVGDAGVLLDPQDSAAWREAMRRAAEDDAWRAARSEFGLAQASTFSWQRCVQETVACYRAAIV